MKRAATLTVLAMVVTWAAPARANPIAICAGGTFDESMPQFAHVELELDAQFVTAPIDLFRDAGGPEVDPTSPTAVHVATFGPENGAPSQADTGSGVVDTLGFVIEEPCLPPGTWAWDAFDSQGVAFWCNVQGVIAGTDPGCSGQGGGGTGGSQPEDSTDDESGCSLGARPVDAPVDALVLGALMALCCLSRRTSR